MIIGSLRRGELPMTEPGFIKALGRWDTLAVGFGAMIGFGWVVLVGGWPPPTG